MSAFCPRRKGILSVSKRKPKARVSPPGTIKQRRQLRVRGIGEVDRRTRASRAMKRFETDLVSDLGGAESLSTQQRERVAQAARLHACLSLLDVEIFGRNLGKERSPVAFASLLRERSRLLG